MKLTKSEKYSSKVGYWFDFKVSRYSFIIISTGIWLILTEL